MKHTLILVLFLFALTRPVAAQTNAYRFSRISVDHGLSNNQIKTVLKDRRGFLWIGTISGLNRYDGYNIRNFSNRPGDTTSLISNDINKVFEGPEGKIWIHTWSGFNVYDPLTELFDRNTDRILENFSIPDGQINDIKKDTRGFFWFLHATAGLFRYSEAEQKTVRLHHQPDVSTSISTNLIASLGEDPEGDIWIVHTNGIVEKIDSETLEVVYRNSMLNRRFRNEALEYNLMVDRDGDLWFYIVNRNAGLYHFKPAGEKWLHFDNTTDQARLNTSIVRGIVQDEEGTLWIATDHGGINLLDKEDFSVKYILHNPEDEKSLSQNSINVLYKDSDGIIWAGTFKNGVSFYHKNINRFQLYRHQISQAESLPFNDINVIVEDSRKNLWIGTNGGGLIYYDREKGTYRQYLHDPDNKNSLTTNVIVSLLLDQNNTLWIGTYFGGLISFDGKRFTRYKHDPDDPGSISDNSVWELFEDSQGNLWIGTLSHGVDRFDRRENRFYHYTMGGSNPIHAHYIPAFMEDRAGNIWVGTGYGIDVLDKNSGRFVHYLNRLNDKTSLSNNSVMSIYQDSRGLIWIATHGGLNVFDERRKTFTAFTKEDGLPHNSILTILEDNNANLWVSTPHGISNLKIDYDPRRADSLSVQFRNYDEKDGLQGIQFNENAACRTSAGELVFGGGNGFNLFRPEEIGINRKLPKVILTDFQIFNRPVEIGKEVNGKVILKESITETDTIVLDHSDNVFSIEFASLSQFHPEKIQYQYILEGFNKEWTATGASQRRVTYTNLDPGDYVFKVKAANNDGIWNETPTQLMVTVLPPFWRSGTAFVLYALGMLAALLFARWLILHNARISFQIREEREKAHRMHELDMIKIKFFTNVSHEFRTPLTLILTPLEKMMRNASDGEQKNQFQLIHRNARRLLNLVNQLLDFRKMEVQEIRLNSSEGDIIKFIREVFYSFSDLSEKNNIRFTFQTTVQSIETLFDQDKLEKILFNLLSNAFKFTPENGKVGMVLDVRQHGDSKFLEINVKDSGIGINYDKQEKIFERFFQDDLPKSMVNQGSGIGLSITREFVKIHGGSISVESEPGKGTCFTVLLPLTQLRQEVSGAIVESVAVEAAVTEYTKHPAGSRNKKPVLLIVEDNEDFRFYLKDNLKLQYSIVEAKNGREGLERALAIMPDLIVSDIMMPEMNGIELCREVKADQRTSHIPIVMLTARTAEEQKIEGFACGANDYVTKPFNFEILQSRIRNLIAQRDALQKNFHRRVDVKTADIPITSLDEKLIAKAIKIVEDNLGEADFSVEKFSRELGMSRVHLYKKLLALTGKSPIEFIRTIRLQRAAQLLQKSQLSVAEIAYQVGFNNPKYFSKYFKDQFKILPSFYAKSVE
jgi:signal transduction histidine kinase/ligand-binding sensor domain-containing protein/DNA-binding response OmpR family regulator